MLFIIIIINIIIIVVVVIVIVIITSQSTAPLPMLVAIAGMAALNPGHHSWLLLVGSVGPFEFWIRWGERQGGFCTTCEIFCNLIWLPLVLCPLLSSPKHADA